jgi:hypothetical protein
MPRKKLSDVVRRRIVRGVVKRHLRATVRGAGGDVPLSEEQYHEIVQALKNDEYVDAVVSKSGLSEGLGDGEILAWIQENWLEVLKILLAILPLFLI